MDLLAIRQIYLPNGGGNSIQFGIQRVTEVDNLLPFVLVKPIQGTAAPLHYRMRHKVFNPTPPAERN